MADHGRGVRHDVGLRHPALDAHVAGHGAERVAVDLVADREQHARGQSAERLDRRAEQRPEGGERRRDGPVGGVDERALVAIPPVRQRPGGGRLLAEAQRLRWPDVAGVLQRFGQHREVGAPRDPVAARVGSQAEPLAVAVEHRRHDRRAPGLHRRRHDPDAAVAHAEALGGEQPGVLGRLPEHDVGPEVDQQADHPGQRRTRAHAREHLAHHADALLLLRELR
jgi:hypothetical protein